MSSRAKALHLEMLTELQRETRPEDYSQIKTMAERFLGAGVISRCSNILELLHQLESCGAIDVDDYQNLKEILDAARLIKLRKIVEDREGEIMQTKEDTPTASTSSQAARLVPETSGQSGSITSTSNQESTSIPEHSGTTGVTTSVSSHASQATETKSEAVDQTRGAAGTSSQAPGSKSGDNIQSGTTYIGGTGNTVSIGSQQSTVYGNIHVSVPSQERTEAAKVKNIRERSGEYKKYCQSRLTKFVETRPCKDARQVLESKHSLLLVGNSGDGKSSVLYYLSANPLSGYLPIQCACLKEIQKYLDLVQGTDVKLMFMVDEPFGGTYTQQKLINDWLNRGKPLHMYLSTHKFVFASRISVWQDCNIHFLESPFFCNKVEVTHARLTADDKENMLKIHVGDSGKLSEGDRETILNIDNPIAYSQCCKLLGDAIQNDQSCHSGSALTTMFERPFSYLSSELKKMADQQKEEYVTLCLVMLAHDKIIAGTGTRSSKSDLKRELKAVCEACNYKLSLGDLRKCLGKLTGTYLAKLDDQGTDAMYKFSHDSIQEAVIMEYGEHFQHCLKFLHNNIIVKIARPRYYNKGEQEFAISVKEKFYLDIAKIFTEKVSDGNRYLHDVFGNPCVRDDAFEKIWCEHLNSLWWFQRRPFCRSRDRWSGICVLCYSAQFGADILHNFLVDLEVKCRCSGEFSGRLIEATRSDKIDIVRYLLSHKPNQDQVYLAVVWACVSDSNNALDILLPELHGYDLDGKMKDVTTAPRPTPAQVHLAVVWACVSNSIKVLNILIPELQHHPRDGTEKDSTVTTAPRPTPAQVHLAVVWACVSNSKNVLNILIPELQDHPREGTKKDSTETTTPLPTLDQLCQAIEEASGNRGGVYIHALKCLFEHCLEYLNPDVVVKIARPYEYTKRGQECAINFPSENYSELAGIFTTKVIDENGKSGLSKVFDNPCVKDESFQSVWVDCLKNSSRGKRTAFTQSKDYGVYDRCVLYHLALSGAHTVLSFLCPDRQSQCKCDPSLPCVLWGAIEGNHVQLVRERLSDRPLTEDDAWRAVDQAVLSDSADLLSALFDQTSVTHHVTMARTGLVTACKYGLVRVADYILTHHCSPCRGLQQDCPCVMGLYYARGQTAIVTLIESHRKTGH